MEMLDKSGTDKRTMKTTAWSMLSRQLDICLKIASPFNPILTSKEKPMIFRAFLMVCLRKVILSEELKRKPLAISNQGSIKPYNLITCCTDPFRKVMLGTTLGCVGVFVLVTVLVQYWSSLVTEIFTSAS